MWVWKTEGAWVAGESGVRGGQEEDAEGVGKLRRLLFFADLGVAGGLVLADSFTLATVALCRALAVRERCRRFSSSTLSFRLKSEGWGQGW